MNNQVNVPLLRKALEHIDAHPEEHDQGVWARRTPCGTAYCLAGHVAVLAGYEIDWSPAADCGYFEAQVECVTALDSWGSPLDIAWVAQDALGVTCHQSRVLFATENSRADLWAIAEKLTNGEIRRLP